MRYDKTRNKNKARDALIRKTKAETPGLAYQEIADMFGLKSRQHVSYIINGKKPRARGVI